MNRKKKSRRLHKGTFTTVPSLETLSGLSPQAQTIYLWMCHYTNLEGTCFPSVKTLMAKAGISSKHTVIKYIDLLIERGLVAKTQRKDGEEYTSNLYQVFEVLTDTQGVVVHDVHRGSASPALGVVQEMDPNYNHTNQNHIKSSSLEEESVLAIDDIQIVTCDEEGNEITTGPFGRPLGGQKRPKREGKNKIGIRLVRKFGEMCHSQLGSRPIENTAGYVRVLSAMNKGGLDEVQIEELFSNWFDQDIPDQELIQITRALSDIQVNAFKVERELV